MKKCKVAKTLILFIVLYLLNSPLSHSQATKSAITIKVDKENYKVVGGKVLLPLYTIIRGRQYFIDQLERIAIAIPDPIIDPTGNYIFYASNTGCGFEAEGMTIFVSDVYGKTKVPILGRCMYLTPLNSSVFKARAICL